MIHSVSSRGCQINLSTQSTDLIDNFEADNIITVDKREGTSEFKRLAKEDLEQWLKDYSLGELWGKGTTNGQPRY